MIGAVRALHRHGPQRAFRAALHRSIDLSAGQSIARFRATVLDANGNPVTNVPVRFSVVSDPAVDTILDGADRFTDNSGDAENRVKTKRTTDGTIRIRAEVLAATAVSVEFTIAVITTP